MKRYVALGDSISIDDYPQHETGRWGLGAASLFARDLEARFPGISFENLTADGATTRDVLDDQLPQVKPSDDPSIVTITAGGNDMLMHLRDPRAPRDLVDGMMQRTSQIVAKTHTLLPNARILLGTVYDPSDGMNVLYGERLDREAAWLARFNEFVRDLCATRDYLTLIDIHRHFLGHGMTAPANERWYWSGLIFEPSAKGAEEVRNLWRAAALSGPAEKDR